jgi:polysaccharide biosynthesis/export protein
MTFPYLSRNLLLLASLAALSACQAFGPSTKAIRQGGDVPGRAGEAAVPIRIIEVGDDQPLPLAPASAMRPFYEVMPEVSPVGTTVDIGDAVEVTIWEAPPATLFGGAAADTRIGTAISTARPTVLPEMRIGPDGTITVPFAGAIQARGRTLQSIERDIVARLKGLANMPQALVRLVGNETATVTVVGEFAQSARLPLSPRGERLLDAIAKVGGVRSPVNLTTIQITRDGKSFRLPLTQIIEQDRNNITLARNDVITALFQPYSFTVLGAAGRNDEVRFEALGISLSQALGRVGGLQDGRANPRGVFLFRWADRSDPAALRDPVIYSFDFKDPAVYFMAQQFPMQDGDLIYVTNSPVAELQRFVGIVSQSILPVAASAPLIQ